MSWDRRGEEFERRPYWSALKWSIGILLAIFILVLVAGLLGWIGGWGDAVKETTGAQNTKEQAYALRDDYRAMEATAGNVCEIKSAPKGERDPSLIEDPAFAYKAKYRDTERDYNRRMDNAFEAGWVRHYPFLSDLPREAPTLREMMGEICDQEGNS